jgi:kynureninase
MDFEGADKVCEALVAERVFVDYRPGCGIRVSPHFYTTQDEIARFFDALDRLRALHAPKNAAKLAVDARVGRKNRTRVH